MKRQLVPSAEIGMDANIRELRNKGKKQNSTKRK